MSYETELLKYLGDADDAFDIRVTARRCYFYDFDGYPVRLWDGVGKLIDESGNEWIGTIDEAGQNVHQTPQLQDPRDGTAARLEFGLPHVDKDTFDALKEDQDLVSGRDLTIYNVLIGRDEGLRPVNPLRFSHELIMRGVRFSESLSLTGGHAQKSYSAFVLARSAEYGRSIRLGGTYTDTSQRQRAALKGYSSDSGAGFVAGNANRTYIVG